MIAATVWNRLIATLQNNPTLSGYVKYVYEGYREPETMDVTNMPCLMLEPVQDGEIDKYMNLIQDIYLTINLFAFSSNNFNEFPKTIVGDQNYRGILDINNDLRACLISSNTLGGNVIDIKIQPTVMDSLPTGKYPIRGLLMPIKILYRQLDGV